MGKLIFEIIMIRVEERLGFSWVIWWLMLVGLVLLIKCSWMDILWNSMLLDLK